MTSCDRLPDPVELGTRTQQVSSALPISSAAMRSMTSSVSCVSCSAPRLPVPSVATSTSTAARGSRKTGRKLRFALPMT
jgi:hypothetical protein